MTVRKVVTPSSSHFRGYFPSLKNGMPIPWESQLEGAFLRILELSPQVVSYAVQPSKERIPLDGGAFTHVPDLRVFRNDGSDWWFEVKPENKLKIASVKARLDAAQEYFARTGRRYSVVSETLIKNEHVEKTLADLMYHRRGPLLCNKELEEVAELLRKHTPRNFSELLTVFGKPQGWRLLGLGIVGIDLDKPIKDDSQVYFHGGHRHANIFA